MTPTAEAAQGPGLQQRIASVLERSVDGREELIVPAVLLDSQQLPSVAGGSHIEDRALAWFVNHGFMADRARRSRASYQNRLWELANAPPWEDVEPEDCFTKLNRGRSEELRPLYLWSTNADAEIHQLLDTYLDEKREAWGQLGVSREMTAALQCHEHVRLWDLLNLARVLGADTCETLLDIVFDDYDLDPVTPAIGAPDLLAWYPDPARRLWFFVEVKGPGDYLQTNQYAWLRRNWSLVRGHMLLLTVVR
jgi:hypothetical protein